MKKNLFFIAVIIFLFSACEEDLLVVDTVSLDDIKISMTSSQSSGLKSAAMSTEINHGDTVDIWSMEAVNIVFSAETNGLPAQGDWYIYLHDADNDGEDYMVGNRPYSAANGPICSIKPKKLGLYYVNFQIAHSEQWFSFFVRHKGTPGKIGDTQENDYAFRMEKEIFNTQNGQIKTGYSLYLKYDKGDFNSWGTATGGIDPKNEDNFKVALYSALEDSFNDGCHGLYAGTKFRLKVCKYSNYVCFTFFTDDFPPNPGRVSYRAHFYSGNFGCDYWSFPSANKSDWATGGVFLFSMIN